MNKPVYRTSKPYEALYDAVYRIYLLPHAKYSAEHYMIQVWRKGESANEGSFCHVFYGSHFTLSTYGAMDLSLMMLLVHTLDDHGQRIMKYLANAPWDYPRTRKRGSI